MLAVVEQGVMATGAALGFFYGPGWYEKHTKPFVQTFEALRQTKPLG